jgi:hypothetical protein
MSYIENGEMETALDEYAVEVPGLMLYYPSRSQSLPKLRAFAAFAQKRMRRDLSRGRLSADRLALRCGRDGRSDSDRALA